MKIVFISSECVPFASTGGLGDVTSSLPLALQALGHEVCRILPLYRKVRARATPLEPVGTEMMIPVGYDQRRAEVFLTHEDGVPTYFISREEYFDRSELYALPHRDYDDSFERFVFFQKAAVALLDQLDMQVDIVHTNDWQTGLVGFYLRWGLQGEGREHREHVVFTIHNIAYQGVFPGTDFAMTGLPYQCFDTDLGIEYYGQISCLKGGIVSADRVITVSPTYADEVRTEAGGRGLAGLLTAQGDQFVGLTNGIDYQSWDPASDANIEQMYDTKSAVAGKAANKRALQERMGLPTDESVPVFGIISRLTAQKGFDLLTAGMAELMERGVQLVLLGSGESIYHDQCEQWAETWPKQCACAFDFDIGLSHQIYAGSDFLLVPSVFEPCGLNQLYAMRYGAIPIVHRTGGLVDTVIDQREEAKAGTGYHFSPYAVAPLLAAVDAALLLRRDKAKAFRRMQLRGMKRESSWQTSARRYEELYRDLTD